MIFKAKINHYTHNSIYFCIEKQSLFRLKDYKGTPVKLTVEKWEEPRTLDQNKLIQWMYTMIARADHIHRDEVEKRMKELWGIRLNGAVKPTADYTIKEAFEYIDHLKCELSDRDLLHHQQEELDEFNSKYNHTRKKLQTKGEQ